MDVRVGEDSWVPKNWWFWTVVLEKTLESPLDCKEIQPVHPKGNQPWVFIGKTDAEAEALILWPPDAKSWLIRKDPDPGKDWGQEEKEMTEDEMVGWHHRLNGHEFEQPLGDGEGQGSLAYCSPWGCKEFDMTEKLSNNKLNQVDQWIRIESFRTGWHIYSHLNYSKGDISVQFEPGSGFTVANKVSLLSWSLHIALIICSFLW